MNNKGEMTTVRGLATARGFAVGPVFIYRSDGDCPVPEYVIPPERADEEVARYRRAVYAARRDLENLIAALRERTGRSDLNIFECHLMLIEDDTLTREVEGRITGDHVNAESAVRRTADGARAVFGRMNDPYFRERVRDIDDIERRILKNLNGAVVNPCAGLTVPSIVVANDLTPSETLQLPRSLVLGFATNGGSTTSHVALLARAMGIPAVTGLVDITERVDPGMTLLLDGSSGLVTVSPTPAVLRDFRDLVEREREISEEVNQTAPTGTLRGGGEVRLVANLHPGAPLDGVRECGARGVGLYRSEYLWMNSEIEPSEENQYAAYREIAEFASTLAPDGRVAIRALDIGGDKIAHKVPGRSETQMRELNPFLGNRSIRYLLSHRDVLKTQLRAILRASAFGRVSLLHPMISCVDEMRDLKAILATVRSELDAQGVPYDRNMPVGAMIEVPSAALGVAAIAKYVDFLSVGTNDLVQYTMAADRGNESVSYLYQPTHPSILFLMRRVIAAAKAAKIPISVCGESASDPFVGTLWAAMGVDTLSMSATYIPVISKILSKLSRADLDEYAAKVVTLGEDVTAEEVLTNCRAWMHEKIPDIDNIVI